MLGSTHTLLPLILRLTRVGGGIKNSYEITNTDLIYYILFNIIYCCKSAVYTLVRWEWCLKRNKFDIFTNKSIMINPLELWQTNWKLGMKGKKYNQLLQNYFRYLKHILSLCHNNSYKKFQTFFLPLENLKFCWPMAFIVLIIQGWDEKILSFWRKPDCN